MSGHKRNKPIALKLTGALAKGGWNLTKGTAKVAVHVGKPMLKAGGKATKKAADAGAQFAERKILEHEFARSPISKSNWYEKASIACGDTVDAMLNQKTGTSEKVVRSLAAKLGFAGGTAGLFTIASTFGTAGTGTAIGNLSGAAFNSAALKWIGGGVSMAAGGWVVYLVSLVFAILGYILAVLTLSKFFGRKRKVKNLDEQEKRVHDTLMLLAVGFRKQVEKKRVLDTTSATALYRDVFVKLSSDLEICIEKVTDWPQKPLNKFKEQVAKIKELSNFLLQEARSGQNQLGMISGAERVDIVSVTVLKLLANQTANLSDDEKLALQALRKSNTRKLKKASMEFVSEYLRLERIDRLDTQLSKVRRIYQKMTKRQRGAQADKDFTVAFIRSPGEPDVEVVIQNTKTGETSHLSIEANEALERQHIEEGPWGQNVPQDVGTTKEVPDHSDILENLSIVAMIALAKSAGAFLSGNRFSDARKKQLAQEAVTTVGISGLTQLVL